MDFKFILVTAEIKPYKLEGVKEALHELGINGMTVTETKGFGRQRGHTEIYKGAEYDVDFLPKIEVKVVVPVEQATQIKEAIIKAARTGKIGDGVIWMAPVYEITRIRTGEKDEAFFDKSHV